MDLQDESVEALQRHVIEAVDLVSEVCQLTGTGDRTGVRRLVDASLTAMRARGEVVVADGAILPRPAV